MKVGLLIYDNDTQTPLAEKVRRAAARYQQKCGAAATTCYVHPAMLKAGSDGAALLLDGVMVLPGATILPQHLWVGVNE